MALSFWSLNIGLLLQIVITLIPVGGLQLFDSLKYGYWHARGPDFFRSGVVPLLEWARLAGDLIFILGGHSARWSIFSAACSDTAIVPASSRSAQPSRILPRDPLRPA